MAIKFRYADVLVGTSHVGGGAVSGEARANIGLGAVYGRVLAFEFKGDDANVDSSTDLALVDAEGRAIFTDTALDPGDTTSDQYTGQEAIIGTTVAVASTVGVFNVVGYPETLYVDAAGDASADTEGMVGGVFAKSPVTAVVTNGTDGDWLRVGLWVEV